MGSKGIVATTAAHRLLLQEGIGDTIRVVADAAAQRRPHRGSDRLRSRFCSRSGSGASRRR